MILDNSNNINVANLDSLGTVSQNTNQKSNINALNSNNNIDVDDVLGQLEKLINDKTNELNPLNDFLKNDDNWYKLRDDYINRKLNDKKIWNYLAPAISTLVYAEQGRKEANRLWSDKISLRDSLLKQLEDLKSQKMSYMSNIAAQKQKYKIEQEALKKAGITNPYFMLKNGLVSGSTPFSFANAGSPNYQSSKGEMSKFSDILKMILAFISFGSSKITKLF